MAAWSPSRATQTTTGRRSSSAHQSSGTAARAEGGELSVALPARAAGAHDRHVREVDTEAAAGLKRADERCGLAGRDLPRPAARPAVEVAVLHRRHDVKLFAPIGAVAVADEAEPFEDVERPIDGRGDRLRVDLAAPLDQLGA